MPKPTQSGRALRTPAGMSQSVELRDISSSSCSSAHQIAGTDVLGTVDASMRSLEHGTYGNLSDAVVRGTPLRRAAHDSVDPGSPPRLRAKDLIAELDTINDQINHMMYQVERAVARLATIG